ncbi:endonuclease III [Cladophialophora psammophila CBS 110553]|uniref:Endonuclease III homolog n=1 Tax=Cladophialophora psammophila CBS 110553 TaxID=1182543 RepID=W9WH73_9EURO|nr:endonuclease III [Cladophialophora psammophila CBS 110553]EXJ57834.1 endonuclease III [Cladophialophora psammophila CBS 110553]
MRTSKISQETTRIFNALSPNSRSGRTTRSSKRLASFAMGYDPTLETKEEDERAEDGAGGDAASTPDIEDALSTSSRSSRKRKFGSDSPFISTVVTTTTEWTSPRRIKEEGDEENLDSLPSGRAKAKPKMPARRTTSLSGTVRIHPPSNWAEIYDTIKAMRQRNPTAPVDTMGCEELFWPAAPPREKRYHVLTSLMLSSQTKDTVTAAAMQRLHTELVPQSPTPDNEIQQSTLTVDNMVACDSKHLDSLIGKVGFHNNKTKYIKQVATILKQEYNSDIPNTIEGLVRLPGVGPKMAYLCMSAAWGVDEGIGVDVHVHRITNLWGWHKTKTPEETRAWLEGWLPRDKWHEINKMLVGLGQTVCLPIGRRCGECDLAGTGLCKAEIRGWKATERRVKKEKVGVDVEDGIEVLKRETEDSQRVEIKAMVEESL